MELHRNVVEKNGLQTIWRIDHSEVAQETGANFKFLLIDKLHMKDHVDSSHLTRFDAFRVNRLETKLWTLKHGSQTQ